MKKVHVAILVVFLALVTVLSGCSLPRFPGAAVASPTQPPPMPTPVVVQAPAEAGAVAALEGALERIYTQVNPSVVNIQVVYAVAGASPAIPEIPGLPFDPGMPPMPQPQGSLGSGFVWDNEGRIVTNNHVIDGADRITVIFYDGTALPARVLGTDADSDLAVLQVDLPANRLQRLFSCF